MALGPGPSPPRDTSFLREMGYQTLQAAGVYRIILYSPLDWAVKESLKKVNLHDKEVADKLAGAYSSGMKRRLSVAISLIDLYLFTPISEERVDGTMGTMGEADQHLAKGLNVGRISKNTQQFDVTGLLQPTSGNAFVNSIDTRSKTNQINTSIGMCPQKDIINSVLWESVTGREHLLFCGRLRKLAGIKLQQAVDELLRSLKLYDGNVADQLAGKYSGGMKRRLSVAISLISDNQVVFLDEPTTGLDPESRNHLWKVINLAKATRAIILTSKCNSSVDLYNYNALPPHPAQRNLTPPPTLYPQQPVSISESYSVPRFSSNSLSDFGRTKSRSADLNI
ncbi:ABC transporter A family member 3 [Acorus calamus]|uniref:ABC transporter A family member 3 n=1 Tax=Acorus calamus TaxID=4465 RepID=A0AAV9DD44_ACOCL|nr:ABC transporter A family member 3 [Acorus calamus]